ncbi:Tctex1 domain-containing protein 3 [Nowakowskiella sp. JEL0407]|nr:Tctex1 domain-containing protein 3 [Nowakowskiella sp. JEL0407]
MADSAILEPTANNVDVAAPVQNLNAVVYENTYQMKPEKKFKSEPVLRIVNEILQSRLQKVKYDPAKAFDLARSVANEILAAVKKLEFDRYKFVVEVFIFEFKGQGVRVASRALWDTTTDSYTSASYKNGSLSAVAAVFGAFME